MKKVLSLAAVVFVFAMLAVPVRAAAADDAAYDVLEAVGASFGLALYNSHIVTGITADAYSKDVYSAADAKAIVDEQLGGLDMLDGYADKLLSSSLVTDSDKDSVRKIKACIVKIKAMITSFETYLDSPTDDNADKFQQQRKDSYASLSDLLGLDKSK